MLDLTTGFNRLDKDNFMVRQKKLSLGICCDLYQRFNGNIVLCCQVEDNLQRSLEENVLEAQIEQERWLTAATEKVTWASDLAGDKYSTEAKLSTIQVSTVNCRYLMTILDINNLHYSSIVYFCEIILKSL